MASSDEKEESQEEGIDKGNDKPEPEVVLDLSGRKLKKLERAPPNQTFATALVLDNNYLQNLANLDSYGELERFSVANNQIVRMYWFARMYSLRILNVPNNNIVQIEGLRELHHLIHLNLSGNNIKNIEGLMHSHKLEHLNLSGNVITQINDLSMLKNLKELFLHRNRISSLHRCNKYLPTSIYIFTLSDNNILDLNELCNLSHLTNLEQFTILNNPSLDPLPQVDENGEVIGPPYEFDNRPYVINWCLNLKVLDGYKVTPKESLKAEWLYSQGKGRHFQVGEHAALVQYLSGICLVGGGWGGAELPDDEEKLCKILQLAKQHQHELRHSSSINGHDDSGYSTGKGGKTDGHHGSPGSQRRAATKTQPFRRNTGPVRPAKAQHEGHRRTNSHTSCVTGISSVRQQQDSTSHSYHVELSSTLYGGDLKTPDTPGLMTQSMDPSLLAQLSVPEAVSNHQQLPIHPMSQSLGPEQMTRSFEMDNMLSCSMGGINERKPRHHDLMIQSLGPEQLKMSLSSYGRDERWDRMTRSTDVTSRPTRLYSDEILDEGDLEGCSQFVPAPDSIMSPEFQLGLLQHSNNPTAPHPTSLTKTYTRTANKNLSSAKHDSGQSFKVSRSPSSSLQRPKTASSGRSSTSTESGTKGSPRSRHKTAHQPNTSPKTARQSPKPAPRTSRTNMAPAATTQSHSTNATTVMKSPLTPKGASEGESDNTDSEMSVSKLQTIKSIAAERKEKRNAMTQSMEEPPYSQRKNAPHPVATVPTSHVYDPNKYRGTPKVPQTQNRAQKKVNVKSGGSGRVASKPRGRVGPSEQAKAAVTLQRYWRGYTTRHNNPRVVKMRQQMRNSRLEKQIRYLTEKLKITESALDKERKLRHMQLDAIRTLWREIQKLQAGRFGVNTTPSTPMTPLTPLTPLETGKKGAAATAAASKSSRVYSEESVKELTDFCTSLQSQVSDLHKSLSMVTQVMNAFCHLPGSQSLLSGAPPGKENCDDSTGAQKGDETVPLSESVTAFTNSILALTTSIKNEDRKKAPQEQKGGATGEAGWGGAQSVNPHEMATSITSLASTDLNSTGQDISTISNDSTEGPDGTQHQEGDFSEDSSQSSHSKSVQGGRQRSSGGPARPSSLPVAARTHAPRANS